MGIELKPEGRRIYLEGNTYPVRDAIRDLGATWDGDSKRWWVGAAKREAAAALVAKLNTTSPSRGTATDGEKLDPEAPIAGRATYRGKDYLLVAQGTSPDGRPYAKLAYRDGSRVFWAASAAEVSVTKRYRTGRDAHPVTLRSLQAFAERRVRERATGVCECSCHKRADCTCEKGFCHVHHDGCDRCGCEN